MNNNALKIYLRFGKYSTWLAIIGMIFYLTFFPSGIYYGFFCGVMAIAFAVTARMNNPKARIGAGLAIGIIDVILSAIAYYGLYLIYSMLLDPVAGPRLTSLISDMLSQYGISLEMFSQLMSY